MGGAHGSGVSWLPWPCGRCGGQVRQPELWARRAWLAVPHLGGFEDLPG